MFGYCHNPKCPYDIWAPGRRDDVENRAFSAYAKWQQEQDDRIVEDYEDADYYVDNER